jgi:hypothetical protein
MPKKGRENTRRHSAEEQPKRRAQDDDDDDDDDDDVDNTAKKAAKGTASHAVPPVSANAPSALASGVATTV